MMNIFTNQLATLFTDAIFFPQVAAHLSNGIKPREFGDEIKDYIHFQTEKPKLIDNKTIEAEIIHTDHFGNLITNLKKEDLPEKFTLEINGRKINKLQEFFAEAEKDEVFMIFGSAGFLEVVAFQNSAENILRAKSGRKVTIKL